MNQFPIKQTIELGKSISTGETHIGQRLHGTIYLVMQFLIMHESLSIASFKNLINNYFKILEDGN